MERCTGIVQSELLFHLIIARHENKNGGGNIGCSYSFMSAFHRFLISLSHLSMKYIFIWPLNLILIWYTKNYFYFHMFLIFLNNTNFYFGIHNWLFLFLLWNLAIIILRTCEIKIIFILSRPPHQMFLKEMQILTNEHSRDFLFFELI